ncbi:unnamed protein product [Gordionus sp. m RMFG-2023]
MTKHVFLALHLGAGYHDPNLYNDYKVLASDVCYKGIKSLLKENIGNDVISYVLKLLENSHLNNAGYGSNLNINGEVECDASVMEGKFGYWGSVGALKRVKNPIAVANQILKRQIDSRLHKNTKLLQPCMLAGDEAYKWAQSCCKSISTSNGKDLITDKTYEDYEKAMMMHQEEINQYSINGMNTSLTEYQKDTDIIPLDELTNPFYKTFQKSINDKDYLPLSEPDQEESLNLGTVGAICLDSQGNFYSGISSGGPILKQPGRIGHAAMYGCGCWAENRKDNAKNRTKIYDGIAISTSGCGEQLIKSLMAKTLSQDLLRSRFVHQAFTDTLQTFLDEASLEPEPSKSLCGAIALIGLKKDNDDSAEEPDTSSRYEFVWGHTCRSMCISYVSGLVGDTKIPKPKVCFSKQAAQNCGRRIYCQGKMIKFS